jgi:hypothetical protein
LKAFTRFFPAIQFQREGVLTIFRRIAAHLAERPFVRSAREDPPDPDLFKRKPTGTVMFGIFLILFSYVIGWPAVAVFGWLSFHTGQPLILIVGGPITYGMSHLVFMAGLGLAGRPYAAALAKRATRAIFEKRVPLASVPVNPDPDRKASGTEPFHRDD